MPGRIESYIHSDAITPNKGGCLLKVSCKTDFAAKTPEFIEFCKLVSRLLFAAGMDFPEKFDFRHYAKAPKEALDLCIPDDVLDIIHTVEGERVKVQSKLREEVTIESFKVMFL
jgi:translation elongation factor EF-Ts